MCHDGHSLDSTVDGNKSFVTTCVVASISSVSVSPLPGSNEQNGGRKVTYGVPPPDSIFRVFMGTEMFFQEAVQSTRGAARDWFVG